MSKTFEYEGATVTVVNHERFNAEKWADAFRRLLVAKASK